MTGEGVAGEVQYVGHVATKKSRMRRIGRLAVKRVFDVLVASLLLVFLAPVFVVVAVAIRLDSPGPIWFKQARVGARPRVLSGVTEWRTATFRIYKFRSMFSDGDDSAHRAYIESFVAGAATDSGKHGAAYKLVGDPRVTRVGRILRRVSIDELPQLINVVRGEMSLVGPRPIPTYEVAQYEQWHMERFHAIPGMTGYWQVHGRGDVPFAEMMRMDIHYVRNESLRLDLTLLALTIPAVVAGRGAE